MKIQRTLLASFLAAATMTAWGEDLTLDQALSLALLKGPDSSLVASNLLAARALDAQTQARASLNLTSSLSYQAAKGINDPAAPFKVATAPSTTRVSSLTAPPDDIIPQSAQGTVTLSAPLTTLAVTGGGTFQVNPDGSVLDSTTLGASLSQTLLAGYFGGTVQAAADKSALTYQAAVLGAQSGQNKVALNVKTAFFTLLAAQARIDVYGQALGQRRDALKFVQAKAQSGTATSYDTKVAQAAVRSAELDLAGGQNALNTARLRLANLLGRSDTEVQALDTTTLPTVPAPTVDDAVTLALKNRVELQTAALSARASGIDAALAAGAIVPTVVLTGSLNLTSGNSLSTKPTTDTSTLVGTVGVRITPPSIDSGQAENQALQARTQQAVYQTQAEQLRRSIAVDVQDSWATWQLNGQRLDLAQTSVDNADVNRQILKSQFDAGSKLISDWLNAEVAYSNAQLALLSARLTCQTSAATLQNLMGL